MTVKVGDKVEVTVTGQVSWASDISADQFDIKGVASIFGGGGVTIKVIPDPPHPVGTILRFDDCCGETYVVRADGLVDFTEALDDSAYVTPFDEVYNLENYNVVGAVSLVSA